MVSRGCWARYASWIHRWVNGRELKTQTRANKKIICFAMQFGLLSDSYQVFFKHNQVVFWWSLNNHLAIFFSLLLLTKVNTEGNIQNRHLKSKMCNNESVGDGLIQFRNMKWKAAYIKQNICNLSFFFYNPMSNTRACCCCMLTFWWRELQMKMCHLFHNPSGESILNVNPLPLFGE